MPSTILGIIASSGGAASTSSYESIASVNGTGSSATITFSSIPSTYSHLQIRCISRATGGAAASDDDLQIKINGAGGTSYARHWLIGDGTTASAAGSASTGNIDTGGCSASNATAANIYGAAIIDIHDYASTTKYKTIRVFGGTNDNTASTSFAVRLVSGLYMATTAITSIDIICGSTNNWTTASTFALYGIKG
jgi:hypothetical protein